MSDPILPSPARTAAPANWYPDTSNPAQERYWDGTVWTDRYQPVGTAAAAAESVASLTVTTPPKKQPWIRKHWLPVTAGVLIFVVGVAIGGAGKSPAAADAKPQPVKTVTVTEEVEVPAEVDTTASDACRRAALELFAIMDSNHSFVTTPLMESNQLVFSYATGERGVDALTEATSKLSGASDTMETNTGRLNAISPDYQTCAAG